MPRPSEYIHLESFLAYPVLTVFLVFFDSKIIANDFLTFNIKEYFFR